MLKTTFVFLSLSLATVLVGCGDEPVPAQPSFANDVRPIMIARCVRCHGGGGKLNGDPLWDKGTPPTLVYLEHYDDVNCGPPVPATGCQPGAKNAAVLIRGFVTEADPLKRMPPPPAEPLSDRQLDIVVRWATKPMP